MRKSAFLTLLAPDCRAADAFRSTSPRLMLTTRRCTQFGRVRGRAHPMSRQKRARTLSSTCCVNRRAHRQLQCVKQVHACACVRASDLRVLSDLQNKTFVCVFQTDGSILIWKKANALSMMRPKHMRAKFKITSASGCVRASVCVCVG